MPLNPAELVTKLTRIFEQADINKDGQLSKFELGSKLDLNALQTLIATMHVTFDADGDGIIDVHEMLNILDADGDEQVSLQEFLDTFTEIYLLQGRDLSTVKGSKRKSSMGRKGRGSFSSSLSSSSLPGQEIHDRPESIMMYNAQRRAVSVQDRIRALYSKAKVSGAPGGGHLDGTELEFRLGKKALLSIVDGVLSSASDGSSIDLHALVSGLSIDTTDEEPRVTLKQFHDVYVTEAGKDAVKAAAAAAAAAVDKSKDPHVDELYHAMDTDGDGTVSKVEFVEFVRAHKPKHGPFSKTAALQSIFGFDKMHEISRADFDTTFSRNMAKGLTPVAFEFRFTDGSGGESSPFDGLLTAEL